MADIYVRSVTSVRSVLGKKDSYMSSSVSVNEMCESVGGIVGINGDFYSAHSNGICLRNGVLHRSSSLSDIGVLYYDGTFETYEQGTFDLNEIIEKKPYQIWDFGPELLDSEGNAKTEFNSTVEKRNPRTVFGYYEPGHYCFVVVDGRIVEGDGITLTDLSQLMKDLGCVQAYNLDGGTTSKMVWGDKMINKHAETGRDCSDAIVIVDAG